MTGRETCRSTLSPRRVNRERRINDLAGNNILFGQSLGHIRASVFNRIRQPSGGRRNIMKRHAAGFRVL